MVTVRFEWSAEEECDVFWTWEWYSCTWWRFDCMGLSGLKQWLQERYASRDCGDEGVEEKQRAWCVHVAILRDSERVRGFEEEVQRETVLRVVT